MKRIKKWIKYNKVIICVALFAVGGMMLFISSAGWGVGFLGWHVILAGVFVFPLVYDLGKRKS